MANTNLVAKRFGVIAIWLALVLLVSACDDGYAGGDAPVTIHYAPVEYGHWFGITEQQLIEGCHSVAVIPAGSFTMRRLMQYLDSDRAGDFDTRHVRARIDFGDKVILVDHSGSVFEPGKPVRYPGWDKMEDFEELFYKIGPPNRKLCDVD